MELFFHLQVNLLVIYVPSTQMKGELPVFTVTCLLESSSRVEMFLCSGRSGEVLLGKGDFVLKMWLCSQWHVRRRWWEWPCKVQPECHSGSQTFFASDPFDMWLDFTDCLSVLNPNFPSFYALRLHPQGTHILSIFRSSRAGSGSSESIHSHSVASSALLPRVRQRLHLK